jgi:2-polyprenyl-6-methoxyphenol hydroxylase-like FAD-dependent oxidoreductase
MLPTAVVIGAGVTGLATARVLADSFGHVLVLDRDELPGREASHGAEPRRGVPQGNHGHVLLGAGQRALDQLFPGILDELVSAGAVPFDPSLDMIVYRGRLWDRPPSGLRLVSFSRPLLEQAMRERVGKLSNVEMREGVAVSGLTGDAGRVSGVTLDGSTTVDAALVVDCTGRGSRSDRWLQALGCATPEVTEVVVGVGYASRLVRRTDTDLADAKAIFVLPDPPHETRAGLVLPIEGDRWIVSLGGWHGDFPADDAGFLAHARSLPFPAVADLLDRAEPLTPVHVHRLASNRRRHFENLTSPPSGYIALGDAVCSFNPVYGQGMTCGILEAAELGRRAADLDVRAFSAWTADLLKVPWRFAAGADFRWPQTTGDRPRDSKLLRRYTARVQRATAHDPVVRRTFTSVQHMLTPPSALFTPRMAWRVLRSGHS